MTAPHAPVPLIVAIDGPAGAGKSSVARRAAERLGLPYIDTGAMYRAVAWLALTRGVSLDDAEALTRIAEEARMEFIPNESAGGCALRVNGELPGDALRTNEASQAASKVSVAPGVRAALTDEQRRMGRRQGGVMEGRDIGTVVFPDAPVKVFLTASPQERARRRAAELRGKGLEADEARIAAEIEERDRRDAGRDVAPMVPAPDAVRLVTDGMTVEEAVDQIVALCRKDAG